MAFDPQEQLRRDRFVAKQKKLFHWRRNVIFNIQRTGVRRFSLHPPMSMFDSYMIPRNRWCAV